MKTLNQFLFVFGLLFISTQANCQEKVLQAAKLQKLDRPAYKIYSICGDHVPKMSDAELSLFAKAFGMAHGNFGSQISGLKARNSSIILVNYMQAQLTSRGNEKELRMAEGVKPALCMTLAAILDSDISATNTDFNFRKVREKEPMKVLASATTKAISSFSGKFIFWIGIEGELMRVNAFDSATGEVAVERGYAGTHAASHARSKLVFSPIYVGQKTRPGSPVYVDAEGNVGRKGWPGYPAKPDWMLQEMTYGGTAGKNQNGFQTELRYCYDPFCDDGSKSIANLILEKVNDGYDGAWLDILDCGDWDLADCFANACRPWDWKNTLKNPDGPVQFTAAVFRDGQDHKMKIIQEYVKSKTGSYPVIIANNLKRGGEDLLDTAHGLMMGKLLLSTAEKPRPLDGFCMEYFMSQARSSVAAFKKNMLCLRTGIKMDLAVMPCLEDAGGWPITEDTPARAAFEEFGYAFYLLAILPDQNQRKSMFGTYAIYNTGSDAHIKVHPQYFWPIGKPKDTWTDPARYKDYDIGGSNTGVYRRDFENAIVLVNSNQTNKQVNLGGSYFDPISEVQVTNIEMAKSSGKILVKQPLAP